MSDFVILTIAVGLAMDALAVAVATSIALHDMTWRHMFRLSWHFGLFQAFMPVLGWVAGRTFVSYIAPWDHWVAFGLLLYVGGKAIAEAYREETSDEPIADPTRGMSLIILSVATSLDALAVGLTFAMLGVSIWYPAAVIGVITGGLTCLGMLVGNKLGKNFGERMEVFGGVVLIGIGLKIVFDHLTQ